jgi:hypothetical protein
MDADAKADAVASELSGEVDAAWRFFLFNWIVIGVMAAALALALVSSDFSIDLAGLAISVGYVGCYAGFAHANANSPRRRDPQVMFVLAGIAQIVLITAIMTPLTYVAAAANLPMQDGSLLAVDKMLRFDWAGYVRFVDGRPVLAALLNYGYTMIRWPIFAIPVMLAAKGCYRRIEEFTFAFGVALMVTTIVSALVPAIGVYQEIGIDPGGLNNIEPQAYLDQLRDLPPTRDGTLRHLELLGLGGIVTFPSFHAASAILYSWALWPVKWARPAVIALNGLMLAATPVNGGHYFIDIVAGVAIAAAAIAAARRVGQLVAQRRFSLGPLMPKSAVAATTPTPAPISAPAAAK